MYYYYFQLYCSARTPKTQVKAVEMQPVKPSSNLDIISGRMDVEKTIKITSEAANRKKVSVFVCGPPMIVQEVCHVQDQDDFFFFIIIFFLIIILYFL
jgi:hypothetical protein